jgi:hypothetical protein
MICKYLKETTPVRVLVSLLSCDLITQKESKSPPVNTKNVRINTFIYDDVVGGQIGGAYAKRVQLDYATESRWFDFCFVGVYTNNEYSACYD